jgi:hypothetical protein
VDVHVDEAWGHDQTLRFEDSRFRSIQVGAYGFDFAFPDEDIGYGVETLGWIDYSASFD